MSPLIVKEGYDLRINKCYNDSLIRQKWLSVISEVIKRTELEGDVGQLNAPYML